MGWFLLAFSDVIYAIIPFIFLIGIIVFLWYHPVVILYFIVGCLFYFGVFCSFIFIAVIPNRIIKWFAIVVNCIFIFCVFWFKSSIDLIYRHIFLGFYALIGIFGILLLIKDKLAQRKKAKEKAQIENSENNKPLLLEPTEKTPSDLIVSSEQKEETPSNLIIPLTQTENSLDTPISLPPQKEKGNKKRKRSEQAENNLTPEEKHQRKTDDIKLRILECERRIAELKKQELEYKLKSLEALEKYREIKRKNTSSNKK
ncbi:hypothetical protein [Avibacterium paragallinarum]|uniref:hypothetical protein n=1 Tax=Avibacterium paragallinarum TaxID=728 RepID=UPI003979C84B